MDIESAIGVLSRKIEAMGESIVTEEATKTAFVMPFLSQVLGYDVFNPHEVIPEFTADVGVKKGEKVDYAILSDGKVQILIECKKYSEKLSEAHASQLYRYFGVTEARLAVLTNGCDYQFFTDLDEPNKMDRRPFLEINLRNLKDHVLPELAKLTKADFDVDSIVSAAGDLKYLSQVKKLIAEQVKEPDEDFVKFFASRVYEGKLTQKVKEQFTDVTRKAFTQFINDKVNNRLQSALATTEEVGAEEEKAMAAGSTELPENVVFVDEEKNIVTTEEEMEGFRIVQAILREVVDISRICHRDTQSYFGVLLDNNNRKPLCRLRFNHAQKYLGLIDKDKNETKHAIDSLEEIFSFADQLKATPAFYEAE